MPDHYDDNDLQVQHALGRIENCLKSLVELGKTQNGRILTLENDLTATKTRLDVFFGKVGVIVIAASFGITFIVDWIKSMFIPKT